LKFSRKTYIGSGRKARNQVKIRRGVEKKYAGCEERQRGKEKFSTTRNPKNLDAVGVKEDAFEKFF